MLRSLGALPLRSRFAPEKPPASIERHKSAIYLDMIMRCTAACRILTASTWAPRPSDSSPLRCAWQPVQELPAKGDTGEDSPTVLGSVSEPLVIQVGISRGIAWKRP